MTDEPAPTTGDPAAPASGAPDQAATLSVRQARLQAAATRALAEAEARRKSAAPQELPQELGGRDGPEPVRFGDWEKDGIISDF